MKYFGQQVFWSKSQSLGCQMKAEVTEVCNGLAATCRVERPAPVIYSRDGDRANHSVLSIVSSGNIESIQLIPETLGEVVLRICV